MSGQLVSCLDPLGDGRRGRSEVFRKIVSISSGEGENGLDTCVLEFGCRHWSDAFDVGERKAFLSALEKHVMKTYASALTFDKSMRLNLDGDIKPGKRLTQVTGQLEGVGNGSTAVLFRLVGTDGSWQIFDVGIHGISIAKTLRADIAAIAGNGGIDAATAALQSGSLQLLSQR